MIDIIIIFILHIRKLEFNEANHLSQDLVNIKR